MNPPRDFNLFCQALLALTCVTAAHAGEADVIAAVANRTAPGVYDLDVTIRSHDTGWDRYADRIEVLAPDGKLLAVRVLEHPHETEQPFTRDVPQMRVPNGVGTVTIRARFKPIGFDGTVFKLALP